MKPKPSSNSSIDSHAQTGLARALSKLGFCSRSEAWKLIEAGRVKVNARVERDPEKRTQLNRDRIEVDGRAVTAESKVYLMLNKPRGLVTTTSDEHGRDTVFECLKSRNGPRVFPVGRLDQASEGLLLFTNDTTWADHITAPQTHVKKTYHVQIGSLADVQLLHTLKQGVASDGDVLRAITVSILRHGEKNSWLEIVLDEGKNRQIRRMFAALNIEVLRLIRVAIGDLQLGALMKGAFRPLTAHEVKVLANTGSRAY